MATGSDAKIVLTAVDQTKAAFESATGNLKALHTTALSVSGAFGAIMSTAFVAELVDFTKNTIESAARLRDLSVQAGLTVESLSALAAVGKASSTGADVIVAASNKLSKALATSTEESKGAATALRALGLSFDAFQKLTPDERIQAIAGAMGTFKDGAQKSAAAMLLFGKSGAEMLPFLKDLAQTGQLHAKITDEQAEAAHRFEVGLGKLRAQADTWKKQLALELLPTLDNVVQELLQIKTIANDPNSKSLLGEALIVTFQTVSVLGVTVLDTLQGIGREIGGIAAQAGYLISQVGDVEMGGLQETNQLSAAGVSAIRDQMVADAAEARRQLNQRTSNLMGITNSNAGAGRSDSTKFQDPRILGPSPDFHKNITGLEGDAKDKDGQNQYDALIKRIKERVAQQQQELNFGRELTDQEKFDIKTRTDLAELMAKYPGLSKSTVDGLLAQSDARALDVHQQQEQIKAGKALNEFFTKQDADLAAFDKERGDERDRVNKAALEQRNALQDSNELLKAEAGLIGATDEQRQVALDQLKIELETKRAIEKINQDLLLTDETRAKAIADVTANGELQKQQVAMRAQIDMQLKGWQAVDSTAHDVFSSIFDKGSDTFKKLRDTLKSTLVDMLYQMTVRPILIQVMGSMTGGGGTGAVGALGSAGGALGNVGSLASLGSSVMGGMSLGNAGATLFANAAGTGMDGLMAATGAFGTAGGAAAAGGGLMGGIGAGLAAIGPVGWIGLAALAAYSMFGGKGGGPKTENGTGIGVRSVGDTTGVSNTIKQIQNEYSGIVSGLGGKPGQLDLGIFSAQDPKGTAQTQLQVNAALNGQTVYSRDARLGHDNIENVGRSDAELQAAMTEETERVVLSALQASNLTGAVGDYLKQLGNINTLSGGAVEASLTRAQTLAQQQAQIQAAIFDLTATDSEKLTKQRQAERDAVDDLNKATVDRLHGLQDEKKANDALASALDQAKSSVGDFNEFMRGITKDVHGYIDKLNATPAGLLPPEDQLSNAKSQFAGQLQLAKLGDRNALSNITGYADQLISAQEGYSASGGDTANVIADIKTQLAGLPNLKSDAEMLAQTITDSTKAVGDKIWDGLWGSAGMLATKFTDLDTNVDGLLNFDELKTALGPLASDDTIHALMSKADVNADGLISKEEAVRAGLYETTAAQTQAIVSLGGINKDMVSGPAAGVIDAVNAAMGILNQGGSPETPGNPNNPGYYAAGGVHSGGWRVVGERGPELEYTPPSRIYSNADSRQMLSQADPALLAEVRALRMEVQGLTRVNAAFARQNLDQGAVIAETNASMAQAARQEQNKAVRV